MIELAPFVKKEDWEKFYYDSGAQREVLISKLDENIQRQLQDESLVRKSRDEVAKLNFDLKNLNTQFGRSVEALHKKGQILYEAVKNNGLSLTPDECVECVRFRVICETWNGVIVRERNTIETLKKCFPHSVFRKVPGEMDHTYAVDYEIYKDDKLTAAIQIKPKSYTGNAPYIQRARSANKHKNQEYFNKFNAHVFDVISDSKGNILNREVLKDL
ncbi:MAG: MjaI family restriction endonuclease [Ferruginibacter sp.]